MSELIPTWGYNDDGKAQIFHLRKGEKLPDGWHSAPKPEHHPNNPNFGQPVAMPEPVAHDEPPKRRGRPPKDAD